MAENNCAQGQQPGLAGAPPRPQHAKYTTPTRAHTHHTPNRHSTPTQTNKGPPPHTVNNTHHHQWQTPVRNGGAPRAGPQPGLARDHPQPTSTDNRPHPGMAGNSAVGPQPGLVGDHPQPADPSQEWRGNATTALSQDWRGTNHHHNQWTPTRSGREQDPRPSARIGEGAPISTTSGPPPRLAGNRPQVPQPGLARDHPPPPVADPSQKLRGTATRALSHDWRDHQQPADPSQEWVVAAARALCKDWRGTQHHNQRTPARSGVEPHPRPSARTGESPPTTTTSGPQPVLAGNRHASSGPVALGAPVGILNAVVPFPIPDLLGWPAENRALGACRWPPPKQGRWARSASYLFGGPRWGCPWRVPPASVLGCVRCAGLRVWTRSLTRPVFPTACLGTGAAAGAPGLFRVDADTAPFGREDGTPWSRACVRVCAPLGQLGQGGLPGVFSCTSLLPLAGLGPLLLCRAPSGLWLPCLWLLFRFFFPFPSCTTVVSGVPCFSGPGCLGPWRLSFLLLVPPPPLPPFFSSPPPLSCLCRSLVSGQGFRGPWPVVLPPGNPLIFFLPSPSLLLFFLL